MGNGGKLAEVGGRGVLGWLWGGLIYRTVVAIWLLPGFDEAYYYLYSRHLNWSYFDHPVMVALTTGVGWWLTGIISPLTIRLGALGLYLLSLMLLTLAASYLYDSGAVGKMTLAIVTLVPLFAIAFGILTSPDNGLIFFWSATLLVALWEFFPKNQPWSPLGLAPAYRPTWRLACLGLLVGLACLSKYHGFILGLSLVGFCASCRPYRRALRSPWALAALVIFVLTLFPLWYWNSQHDWISFRFQLGMRFDRDQSRAAFSFAQMVGYWLLSNLYLFPLFGLPLWWLTLRQTGRQLGQLGAAALSPTQLRANYQQALVLWLSLPIMMLFTLLGGQQQIFPAWPAPGYWGVAIFLAAQAVVWQRHRPRLVRRWLWGSGLFLGTLSLLALLHLQLGIFQKPGHYSLLGGFVEIRQDGSTELIDPQQLRRLLAADPQVAAALAEVSFVFTNEYYLGGYLAMALHPLRDIAVTAFSQDPRGFAFWFNQADWLGQNALFMTLDRFVQDSTLLNQYRSNFDRIEPISTLALRRGGEVTETIHVFKAVNFRQVYNYPYGPSSLALTGLLAQAPASIAEQGGGS